MITEMLVATHKYFKINEDSSSVSLRDVSRFIILYNWCAKSLKDKKDIARQNLRNIKSYENNLAKYNLAVQDYSLFKGKGKILKLLYWQYVTAIT